MASLFMRLCLIAAVIVWASGPVSGGRLLLENADPRPVPASILPVWVDSYDGRTPLNVDISFGSQVVKDGDKVPVQAMQQVPSVTLTAFHEIDQAARYTLIMVDPDSPSPNSPINKNHVQWLVTDISVKNPTLDMVVKTGTEVFKYEAPQDLMGSHRFYVLLFKQPADFKATTTFSSRDGFSVRQFSTESNLSYPVAGAFFTTE